MAVTPRLRGILQSEAKHDCHPAAHPSIMCGPFSRRGSSVSEVIEHYESTSTIEQQVKTVLAGKLDKPASTIRLDDDLLIDLGLDSLSLAELIVQVEETTGMRLRGSDLLDATTVGDIVNLLSEQLQPQKA